MYWANFLHFYQPPTQKEIWVRRITNESYRKIFSGLIGIKRARLTININGILCELLEKYGGKDVLDCIRSLLRSGNIELTGSAKYHAFLPLLPESEIERQIILNEGSLTKYFGGLWKKKGFFSPEMAYSKTVARVAARMGYSWIVVDELGFPIGKKIKSDSIYTIEDLGEFKVFFRERNFSFLILSAQAGTVPSMLRYLGAKLDSSEYALTAMDGETFGHHRPGLEKLLFDLLREERIIPAMISDLPEIFPARQAVEVRDSTWAVTKKNLEEKEPFARWKGAQNNIQQMQWRLTALAVETVNRARGELRARRLLDEALHSDQYWWASARPWWSLEMIERGAHELKSVVQISRGASLKEKARAEELYRGIIYTGFEWQRSGLVDELSRKEDEEIHGRLEDKGKVFISREEYKQMIDTLLNEVRLAAVAEDYHRAAMIKERVRELSEEMKKANGS